MNVKIYALRQAKYLWINVDQKLDFNFHLQQCKSKIATRAAHIRRITFKKRSIHIKHLNFIKAFVVR